MLFCRLLMSSIGTIAVSLRYGIAGAYKCLWPRKVTKQTESLGDVSSEMDTEIKYISIENISNLSSILSVARLMVITQFFLFIHSKKNKYNNF